MSPEINGNPPSAAKRKKNRDKKSQKNDMNIPPCDYLPSNQMGYNSTFNNLSIPDLSAYYSVLNFSNGSEPLSLPIHPANYSNYNQTRLGTFPNISTPKNHLCPRNNNDVGDYMSLPVTNLDPEMDESGKRRYSDPGVPHDDSDSSCGSLEEKVISKLLGQVNVLKDCNRKLSKEVMEMRVELNMLKQQVQQQNMRHFEQYEPGMLADVVREVRDAARVREDALLAKVKYIMEEKQLNMSHLHLISEKNRSIDRIAKLEEQLKNMAINYKPEDHVPVAKTAAEEGYSARQVLELEREALELRRELQDTRAKKEEADQKVLQLNKKLASISKRNDVSASDVSENGKTDSADSASLTTTTSSIIHNISAGVIPRVTLSGPVTDL